MHDSTRVAVKRCAMVTLGIGLILIWSGLFSQLSDASEQFDRLSQYGTPDYARVDFSKWYHFFVILRLTDEQRLLVIFGYVMFFLSLGVVLGQHRGERRSAWFLVGLGASMLVTSYAIGRKLLMDTPLGDGETLVGVQAMLGGFGFLLMSISLAFVRFDRAVYWVYLLKRVAGWMVVLVAYGGAGLWGTAAYCIHENGSVDGALLSMKLTLGVGIAAAVLIGIAEFVKSAKLHCVSASSAKSASSQFPLVQSSPMFVATATTV